MLLGFKTRFAPMIEDHSKRHTIRGARKIAPRVGEVCHCYVNPRQKSMRLLGRWPCVKMQNIVINEDQSHPAHLVVSIDGIRLDRAEADLLFFADGFRDQSGETFPYMAQARGFWEDRLPFTGHIIHWDPKGK